MFKDNTVQYWNWPDATENEKIDWIIYL